MALEHVQSQTIEAGLLTIVCYALLSYNTTQALLSDE